MPSRIKEDHKKFIDVISGKSRDELKRLIKTGAIVRNKPKGGRITITIPRIDIPHFVFGDSGEGIGRGPGKEGDIIGRDPQPGGDPNGEDSNDGIRISIDMEHVLKFLEDELRLPRMVPKPSQTFDEIKIKYNSISKVGINSLRHMRRTMKEAIKRTCASGDSSNMVRVPGSSIPVKIVSPIKSDFRYRKYKENKIPASNAVIFFARDYSGSMDDYRCQIASDMSWWIDCWIKKFYKKVERCFLVHDTQSREVTEEEFYSLRDGGGTKCSSAFKLMEEQLENRFPPEKYNIYVFYFTDGENTHGDNKNLIEIMQTKLGPDRINLIGVAQIGFGAFGENVKEDIDTAIKNGILKPDHVRTVEVSRNAKLPNDARDQQILSGIKQLLGKGTVSN